MPENLAEKVEERTRRLVILVSMVLLPLAPLASQITRADPELTLVAALLLGLLVLACLYSKGTVASYILATVLVGQAMLMTAVFTGHPWQADMHMLFFVALAVVALKGMIGPLVWAAGFTLVHHATLSFALPSLVYDSQDLAMNLFRTALHGGIVMLEVSVLAMAIRNRKAAQAALSTRKRQVEMGDQMARDAQAEVEEARARASKVIEGMQTAFSQLARSNDGDLEAKTDTSQLSGQNDFDQTLETLRAAFTDATAAISEFSSDSLGLDRAMDELSQLTQVQADVITEMSHATGEIVSELAQSLDRRKKGVFAAKSPSAEDSEASRQIGKITELMQDMALQTNLLSLIAGVEAGREDAESKGSEARVAAEIRRLSRKTAETAIHIRHLVGDSMRLNLSGSDLDRSVNDALSEIRDQVNLAQDLAEAARKGDDRQVAALADLQRISETADEQSRAIHEDTGGFRTAAAPG